MQIELPDEFAPLLGPDLATAVCEAVPLQFVQKGRLTVAVAGERLGLGRLDAIRWYMGHGYPYPDLTPAELRQQVSALDERLPIVPTHVGVNRAAGTATCIVAWADLTHLCRD